jgi:hypothetical protein
VKRKVSIILFLSLLLLYFPSVLVLGVNTSTNNTVVWTEGKEYEYEILEGSAKVEYLGTIVNGNTFKMILGGSEDIFIDSQWDELKVKFQKLTPEPGEETQFVRPYLTSNYPNSSQSVSDIAPPFFVWLLNESTRTEDGEVHRYFNDFCFNGATYDSEEGVLKFFNGSQNPDLGYQNLVIKLKNDDGNGGPIILPWWLQALIGGILSALGGLIIKGIYDYVKKKKERDNN